MEEKQASTLSHTFDVAKLSTFLGTHIDNFCGLDQIEKFDGGASNPTFLLIEKFPKRRRFVLRKKPPGVLLASAHQVEREYRVLTALRGTKVPVPNVRVFCQDATILGTSFYIMDFVEGRIFRDARLPTETPNTRAKIYEALNETLAALHKIDHVSIGLGDFGRSTGYVQRQVDRWTKQYRAAQTDTIPEMELLIEFLPKNVPYEDTVSITHGDYRIENVMFHPTEPRIIAVLDRELSTIGSPLADIAYNCLLWHSTSERWGALQGVDFSSSGIPSEFAYRQAYCQRTNRKMITHWSFYLAFSLFRLAAISQGVYKRILDGNASTNRPAINETKNRAQQAWRFIESDVV